MRVTLAKLAAAWVGLALFLGFFFRTYSQMLMDYAGPTRLAFTHTHAMALGALVTLILLLLEHNFSLSETPGFKAGLWTFQGAALSVVTMLFVRGLTDIHAPELPRGLDHAIAGLAGISHVALTVGFILILRSLIIAVRRSETAA